MKAIAAMMARLHYGLSFVHLSVSEWHLRRALYWRRIWKGQRK